MYQTWLRRSGLWLELLRAGEGGVQCARHLKLFGLVVTGWTCRNSSCLDGEVRRRRREEGKREVIETQTAGSSYTHTNTPRGPSSARIITAARGSQRQQPPRTPLLPLFLPERTPHELQAIRVSNRESGQVEECP